jgi:hypothetical protein
MKGKHSIKIVLPLLATDMAKAYKDLTLVSNGGNTYPRMNYLEAEHRGINRF